MSYHAAGAIEDIGKSPYNPIAGNPVIALLAQINRFAGKTLNIGGTCGARKLVAAAHPLVPTLSQRAAEDAALIMWQRYSCVPLDLWSAKREKWAADGFFVGNAWVFVLNNVNEITITLAQLADKLGLEPASTGITARDPKMTPKFPVMTVVMLAALSVGAVMISRRTK